jgi:hypothetical protein
VWNGSIIFFFELDSTTMSVDRLGVDLVLKRVFRCPHLPFVNFVRRKKLFRGDTYLQSYLAYYYLWQRKQAITCHIEKPCVMKQFYWHSLFCDSMRAAQCRNGYHISSILINFLAITR